MQRTITEKPSGIFVFARSSFAGGEEFGDSLIVHRGIDNP
jgi:hypothetical protein